MKILLLVLLLLAIIGGGIFFTKDLPRLDLSSLMPFSSITPGPSTSSIPITSDERSGIVAPSVNCPRTQLPAVIEGPYYKTGSPERKKIDEGVSGTKLILQGQVLDTNCNPIQNAWIDFWQADSTGQYDNNGYKLRGHQYTDIDGKYFLETIIPGEYTGRTPHLHAKVKARGNSPILTVQIFLPDLEKNKKDPLFNRALLMDIKDSANGKTATFNFVVNTNL